MDLRGIFNTRLKRFWADSDSICSGCLCERWDHIRMYVLCLRKILIVSFTQVLEAMQSKT